ncbi:hypothetical protein SJAG_00389 [Schizosaccharomyces japonicus yFS275]|uniref:Uncharacterized protein n=1 Tax=Schizosaccharomyces japonicus (strain yFS275 / FY16936) TaxID=402676 RepID=B6JVH9_SCHJY|nr:hypothetical protein SJAG_00389 [Schizosaccharomyces japonicus yFS275]EEB05380.1 hypothetical protein SJAG_00389 [Schizosaccharomyces japonicus yFS275]
MSGPRTLPPAELLDEKQVNRLAGLSTHVPTLYSRERAHLPGSFSSPQQRQQPSASAHRASTVSSSGPDVLHDDSTDNLENGKASWRRDQPPNASEQLDWRQTNAKSDFEVPAGPTRPKQKEGVASTTSASSGLGDSLRSSNLDKYLVTSSTPSSTSKEERDDYADDDENEGYRGVEYYRTEESATPLLRNDQGAEFAGRGRRISHVDTSSASATPANEETDEVGELSSANHETSVHNNNYEFNKQTLYSWPEPKKLGPSSEAVSSLSTKSLRDEELVMPNKGGHMPSTSSKRETPLPHDASSIDVNLQQVVEIAPEFEGVREPSAQSKASWHDTRQDFSPTILEDNVYHNAHDGTIVTTDEPITNLEEHQETVLKRSFIPGTTQYAAAEDNAEHALDAVKATEPVLVEDSMKVSAAHRPSLSAAVEDEPAFAKAKSVPPAVSPEGSILQDVSVVDSNTPEPFSATQNSAGVKYVSELRSGKRQSPTEQQSSSVTSSPQSPQSQQVYEPNIVTEGRQLHPGQDSSSTTAESNRDQFVSKQQHNTLSPIESPKQHLPRERRSSVLVNETVSEETSSEMSAMRTTDAPLTGATAAHGSGLTDTLGQSENFAAQAKKEYKNYQNAKKVNKMLPGSTTDKMKMMNRVNKATGGNAVPGLSNATLGGDEVSSSKGFFSKIKKMFHH